MNIGYQTSKNRFTTSVSLPDDQAFRLRRLAAEAGEKKLSPYIGQLIDQEWERQNATEAESLLEPQAA